MKRITSVLNVETDRVDNTVGTGGWGISVGVDTHRDGRLGRTANSPRAYGWLLQHGGQRGGAGS